VANTLSLPKSHPEMREGRSDEEDRSNCRDCDRIDHDLRPSAFAPRQPRTGQRNQPRAVVFQDGGHCRSAVPL